MLRTDGWEVLFVRVGNKGKEKSRPQRCKRRNSPWKFVSSEGRRLYGEAVLRSLGQSERVAGLLAEREKQRFNQQIL